MANQEQVAILMRGANAWNAWRWENKEVEVDLSRANLRGANLIKANLFRADLNGAYLADADLADADLDGANLTKANFTGAHLSTAKLTRADLTRASLVLANLTGADLHGSNLTRAHLDAANLTEANLTEANLNGAYIHGANLTRANLTEAYLADAAFADTVFADTNLSGTKGLDQCKHFGPSTLDHHTLAKSGDLPKAFLHGCGLQDWQIESAKLLNPNLSASQVTDIAYKIADLRSDPAIQFYSCFISYSSTDDDFTRRLHDGLQERGVRCWFAPEDLKIGDEFRQVIDSAIRLRDKLLLILSKHSIESQWVKDEVEAAYEEEDRRGKTILFPIRLDDAVLETSEAWAAKLRRQRHIGDFTDWKDHDAYQQSFDRLLRDLKA